MWPSRHNCMLTFCSKAKTWPKPRYRSWRQRKHHGLYLCKVLTLCNSWLHHNSEHPLLPFFFFSILILFYLVLIFLILYLVFCYFKLFFLLVFWYFPALSIFQQSRENCVTTLVNLLHLQVCVFLVHFFFLSFFFLVLLI